MHTEALKDITGKLKAESCPFCGDRAAMRDIVVKIMETGEGGEAREVVEALRVCDNPACVQAAVQRAERSLLTSLQSKPFHEQPSARKRTELEGALTRVPPDVRLQVEGASGGMAHALLRAFHKMGSSTDFRSVVNLVNGLVVGVSRAATHATPEKLIASLQDVNDTLSKAA